ncbi:hypothetical protein Dimus_011285 [Dionaea muscipula]
MNFPRIACLTFFPGVQETSAYTATNILTATDVEDMKLSFPPPMAYQYCRPLADDTNLVKHDITHLNHGMDPSLEPLGIRRVGLTVEEEFLLQSFSATRPRVPQFLEIINLQSLEEHDLALIPHQLTGDMSLYCFELYGVTGVVERAAAEKALKDQKRFARRQVAQVLSSDDELSDEESYASNRV